MREYLQTELLTITRSIVITFTLPSLPIILIIHSSTTTHAQNFRDLTPLLPSFDVDLSKVA